tara:strand:- start:146 stop:295 length:150 start_codon:yes stop_codon:yes gene_type:complete
MVDVIQRHDQKISAANQGLEAVTLNSVLRKPTSTRKRKIAPGALKSSVI